MNRKARLWTAALVALEIGTSAAYGQLTYQTVAQGGQTAPGTNRSFFTFTSVAINASGQVTFAGRLQGDTLDDKGVWAGSVGNIQLHARENSPADGAGGGVFGDEFTRTVIGDNGRVMFQNTLPGSPTRRGIWEGPGGGPLKVALEGDTIPGTSPATQYFQFDFPSYRGGRVAARVYDSTFVPGVFAGPAGNFQIVARNGSPVPDVPGATFGALGNTFTEPLVNRYGTVAFGSPFNSGSNRGVFTYTAAGAARAVVLGGESTGDAGGSFGTSFGFSQVSFNDIGQVAFNALISSGPSSGSFGVFVNDGISRTDSRLIARTAGNAPGIAGATYFSLNGAVIGGGGHVAFTGNLNQTGGINNNNDSGVWIGTTPTDLRLVVRENDQVPGLAAGILFGELSPVLPSINSAGLLAFTATLKGTGVGSNNDLALFATDGLGNVRLIAREGAVPAIPGVTLPVVDGGIIFASGAGGQDGRPMALNDRGQLAFALGFGGTNTDRVFLTTVPQQGIVINGTFTNGSLDSWATTGPGTAAVADAGNGNLAALLTAGSPVTLSQDVDTLPSTFLLEFDFKFTTLTGTLEVTLDGTSLANLLAPGTLPSGFTHFSTLVSNPALFDRLDIPLAFRLDGIGGSKVFIDNIHMTPVPEPSSMLLVCAAGLGLVARRWRRANRSDSCR